LASVFIHLLQTGQFFFQYMFFTDADAFGITDKDGARAMWDQAQEEQG
jgi:hypothetical protein